MAAIKGLLGSKKFWMVILGSVVVGVMKALGMDDAMIATVGGLFGIGIAGQGLADFGKNAAK